MLLTVGSGTTVRRVPAVRVLPNVSRTVTFGANVPRSLVTQVSEGASAVAQPVGRPVHE